MNAYAYTLNALPIGGAASYQWEFSTSNDFGAIAFNATSAEPSLALTAGQLASGQRDFVRVLALDEANNAISEYPLPAATAADSYFYNALHPVSVSWPAGCLSLNTSNLVANHTASATKVVFQVALDPAFLENVDVTDPNAPAIPDPANPVAGNHGDQQCQLAYYSQFRTFIEEPGWFILPIPSEETQL